MRRQSKGRTANDFSAAAAAAAILLLLLPGAAAFGVSPAKQTVNFEPNASQELEFRILNSDHSDLTIYPSGEGDLAGILFFGEGPIHLKNDVYVTKFKVMVTLPEDMKPGVHTAYVKLTPQFTGTGSMLRAFASPLIPINIRVPYPSKYAEVSLGTIAVDEGTPVPINLEFDNLGSVYIFRAGGKVTLFGPRGEEAASLGCPLISIAPNSYAKSECKPSPVLQRGVYSARAQAEYDDAEVEFTQNITVGKPLVRITEMVSRTLTARTVNEVSFTVRNEWNMPLVVAGFLQVADFRNEMPLFELDPGEERTVTGYLDATEIVPGEYGMEVTLGYADQLRTETFTVTVEETRMVEEVDARLVSNLIIAMAILLVLVAAWLVVSRLRKDREN